MLTRRQFLTLGACSLAGACAGAGYTFAHATTSDLTFEHVKVRVATLPAVFQGFRIGFLSDIHLGDYLPNEMIERAVKLLADEGIDILLLGGDYLWVPGNDGFRLGPTLNPEFEKLRMRDKPRAIFERLCDLLKTFHPPHGIHAIFGNHDRWVNPYECRRAFDVHKINLLVNGVFNVSRDDAQLRVIGLDDYWTGIPRFPELPEKRNGHEVRVLLSHNPDLFEELFGSGNHGIDLGLAGHTHGGQIVFPLIGALTYNIRHTQYRSGMYTHPSGVPCYTTRGLGVVEMPLRVNCPPEVTLFELIQA